MGDNGKRTVACPLQARYGVGLAAITVLVTFAMWDRIARPNRDIETIGMTATQLVAFEARSTIATGPGQTEKVAITPTGGSTATIESSTATRLGERTPIVSEADIGIATYERGLAAQRRGDNETAQRLYTEVIQSRSTAVDPYYRLQQVVHGQGDAELAIETFQSIINQTESVAGRFARTLSLERLERRKQLRQLLDDEPLFAPATYELAGCYSDEPQDDPRAWLTAMYAEQAMLERFLGLNNAGHLVDHFLDPAMAPTMIEDAQLRLAALNARIQGSAPVRFTLNYNNPSWSVVLHFAKPVAEVFLRESADPGFRSLGMASVISPITGRPHPNAWAMLESTGPAQIEVQFVDTDGNLIGPFEYLFDPAADKVKWAREMLRTMPPEDWAAFGKNQTGRRLYFSSLYSMSNAISEVRYGFDRDEPNQVHHLERGPQGRIVPYAVVPSHATFATIQVVWADGTASKIVRIDR